ncbi:hypothetical protein HanRHA438_Chr07g0302631 [Helianthus annuus]|nr:hypothetical protein HanIR_Chr07g0315211 [Helianthus annuus]KAJ0907742.1 hypothetical protein HanRHA438_Chr07g0302631 [Helianthus annuus]
MYPINSSYRKLFFLSLFAAHLRIFHICKCVASVYFGACNQHLVSEPRARRKRV